jgi:hypothetical protein
MWPTIQALTATLTITENRSPPDCARELGKPARTRASSGLSIGGIGAWPTSVALLSSTKACALSAR